jgi:4-carboxymuconolactone decarboxylase
MHRLGPLLGVLLGLIAMAARAEERLPLIPPAQYDQEQKQAAAEFEAARKTPVFGPFELMMHSPQLMSRARAMGDYLRYRSALGNLAELVILMTAREWSQDYEWSTHYPLALQAGIGREVADAIGEGRRPSAMTKDEEVVYRYVSELLRTKHVSDATFERAKSRFGAKGVVDMTGIAGYYTFVAMQLNAAQYPVARDGRRLPRLTR